MQRMLLPAAVVLNLVLTALLVAQQFQMRGELRRGFEAARPPAYSTTPPTPEGRQWVNTHPGTAAPSAPTADAPKPQVPQVPQVSGSGSGAPPPPRPGVKVAPPPRIINSPTPIPAPPAK